MSDGEALDGRRRVVIARLSPSVDGGRHPVKRTVGEVMEVEADLLIDGHDVLAARLHVRHESDPAWTVLPMTPLGASRPDGFGRRFALSRLGAVEYRVEGWVDTFASFRHGLERKVGAGQDVSVELLSGGSLVAAAAVRAAEDRGRPAERPRVLRQPTVPPEAESDPAALRIAAELLADARTPIDERIAVALDAELGERMARHPDLRLATLQPEPYRIVVEPERARFSAWYELFPRSCGKDGRHGTLSDVIEHLPYVAGMGFDVLYMPPVHPIGRSHRKGPNNTLAAGDGDPGSPWAIGAAEGGHEALHPELGTLDDFARLVSRARELGIEIALDIAFQASPDHPWVKQHPDWFVHRADGSIQYAENPPKKYQDVYPFDFECDDWRGLWRALASVFFTWIDRGVRVFRVDNPHTKPIGFWAWCLAEIRGRHPDVIFLSEAFTRPLMLEQLAKIGFSQSYTYFTWRTTARELQTYLEELVARERVEFLRPSFWPNTPDILPEHLQLGVRPIFQQRAILAATLSSCWGIYGPAFELCDARALPGREEYQDSEKFQLRRWDLDAPHSLRHLLARLNRIRREHPALQGNRTLRFHPTDSDALLCYSKTGPEGDVIVCVVSLDPFHVRAGFVELDLAALGLPLDASFQVHDLIGDGRYLWNGARNYIELDPQAMPAQIFAIRHRDRREQNFEYFL
jgi:starch synthase (maltosyl-transferring)